MVNSIFWIGLIWIFMPEMLFFHSLDPARGEGITPPPPQVCSKVNRLNVRSGPGTQYDVVAGMVYNQCAERLSISDDGKWIQVEAGWVASDFVEIREGVSSPTLSPTVLPTASLTAPPRSTQTLTALPVGPVATPASGPALRLPGLPDPAGLRNWLIANPVRILLLLSCFYIGLLSAKNLGTGRQIFNGFLVILFTVIVIAIWNFFLGRFFTFLFVRTDLPVLLELGGLSLASYGGSLLLGKFIYRRPGSIERGANTPCSVCGQKQRSSRMKQCPKCHQPYCDFPQWNHSSIRATIDQIVLWIAIPVGLILTAFSILGGLLVLGILSIPYFVLRELLPDSQRPAYWRNCGRDGYCSHCAAKIKPLPVYSDSSGGYSGSDSSYDDHSSSSSNSSYEDDRSRDDEDDHHKGGSLMDGWLFSYSDNRDDDDDDD